MNHSANIVEVASLKKMYKSADFFAIDNLSFKIKHGEIFGLLGPNGAGKTTTIKILTGLLKPNSGEVIISGLSIKNSFEKIKSLIGVVPQEIALYPNLTTLDNLRIFGTLYGIPPIELKKRIFDLLQVYGLKEKANQKVKNLSGGMKRRLNIIAGILHSPQLLILDEPTAGIDVQSKKFILANLKELNHLGTTILYTSHFMEEAEKFCTDIAIIDQGGIIANNSPEKLINQTDGCANLEDVFLNLTGRRIRE
jgi:ABC-2 type transport system ATP-binding protein